jgi:tetratricopeptide (TPR) repeat protein
MSKIATVLAVTLLAVSFSNAQEVSKANPKALEALSKADFRGAVRILDSDIDNKKNLFASYELRAEVKSFTGDFAGAFIDLSKAIEIDPTKGGLYQRRADIRLILNQPVAEVLADLDLAIVNGVKHETVYAARGSARSTTGDIDGSIADYKVALAMRPGYAQPTIGLASAYRRKGDDEAAMKLLEDFVALVEQSEKKPEVLRESVVASSSSSTPSSGSPAGSVETTSLLTRQEVTLRRMPTAEETEQNKDRMMQAKNTALAYAHLASLYEKKKDFKQALLVSDKGIARDPNDFYGLGIRGIIKLSSGDFGGAVSDFDRAIRITPKNASLYLNRGLANMLQNKQDEANRDFGKFLELTPNGKATLEKQIEYAKKLHQKID